MSIINSAKQLVSSVTRRLGTDEPLKSDTDSFARSPGNAFIEFIPFNSGCFIELCEQEGGFFYRIMLEKFDDSDGCSYFVEAYSENEERFTSRSKAVSAAKEKAKKLCG